MSRSSLNYAKSGHDLTGSKRGSLSAAERSRSPSSASLRLATAAAPVSSEPGAPQWCSRVMPDRAAPFLVALVMMLVVAALAVVFADAAHGAVFARLLRTEGHVGDLVPAEVDAWTATRHPPLYLIPAAVSAEFTTTRGAP